MKLQSIFFCFLFSSISSLAQLSTAVYEGPFDDVKLAAKRSNRLIFIDFSSESCAHCKKMNNQIYTDQSISNKLNTDFLVYKISHDEPEGKALIASYKIEEYPAFLIVDAAGNTTGKILGMQSNKIFYKKLEKFGPTNLAIDKPSPQVQPANIEMVEKSEKKAKKAKKKTDNETITEPQPTTETGKSKKKKKALFF